jgi:hypothetical protein
MLLLPLALQLVFCRLLLLNRRLARRKSGETTLMVKSNQSILNAFHVVFGSAEMAKEGRKKMHVITWGIELIRGQGSLNRGGGKQAPLYTRSPGPSSADVFLSLPCHADAGPVPPGDRDRQDNRTLYVHRSSPTASRQAQRCRSL